MNTRKPAPVELAVELTQAFKEVNMKHTKGPWITQELDRGEIEIWSEGHTNRIGYLNPSPMKQYKANAHLIAAAPELLETLEMVCDEVTDLTFDQLCKVKDAIRKARGQAIAKARGES